MKILAFCLLCAVLVATGGCSWAGRTAGKAQAKIERKTQDVERGYQEGYEEEKAKTHSRQDAPAKNTSAPTT